MCCGDLDPNQIIEFNQHESLEREMGFFFWSLSCIQ